MVHFSKQDQDEGFIVPHREHVHHWVSINVPQLQTHPRGRLLTSRSSDERESKARVRFLKEKVFLGVDSSRSISAGGRFFWAGGFDGTFRAGPVLAVDSAAFVFNGAGRSAAQTSQHRKLGGFSRVHVGQVQGDS